MHRQSNRKGLNVRQSSIVTLLFVAMSFLAPINAFGQLNLWDAAQGLPDLDNRAGHVAPTTQQLALVDGLAAEAEWNQFGTVHAMLKYGGFLATGLSGDPVSRPMRSFSVNASAIWRRRKMV